MNTQMAINLRYEDIDTLQDINGITIAEIEKRARPARRGDGKSLNNGGISDSGFLGANESFKEVIKADWETVYSMDTTHIELATHIKAIWDKEHIHVKAIWDKEYIYENPHYIIYNHSLKGYNISYRDTIAFKPCILCFGVTVIAAAILTPWALIGLIPTTLLTILVKKKAQILYVTAESHKGCQENLFLGKKSWNELIKITNIHNGEAITIGEGVIDYIAEYGFYEGGGDQNKYRVNPKRLVTILTGIRPNVN